MTEKNLQIAYIFTLFLFFVSVSSAAAAEPEEELGDSQEEGTVEIPMDAIVVEGVPGVVTEYKDTYSTGRSTVGYKQPVEVQRAPQTINVITHQRLEDSDAKSIEDAAFLLPNLNTATGNGFTGSLYSRGHEVFTYNVDGAPRPFLSLYGTVPDLVFFDRVEVLSGPSGVFQGSGEPVGTLNFVRKRAQSETSAEVTLFGGSHEFMRLEGDVSAPLTENGAVRGRLIGYGLQEDSFIDFAERERGGVYGTLEFDLTEATTLSVGAIAETHDQSASSGQPTFTDGRLLDVAPETFFGAPWNKNDSDSREWFLELEHVFDNGGVVKLNSRYYGRDSDIKTALASTGVDPMTGDFDFFVFAREWNEETSYVDLSYTAPFEFFGRSSEFTLGIDYRDTEQETHQNFDFSAGTQNIATFDPRAIVEPDIEFPGVGPGFRLNTVTDTQEFGAYGYGRFALLDQLTLTVGARASDYDSETTDVGRDVTSEIDETEFVPFAGLSYDLTEQVTTYVSYSEIFQPQLETAADGSQLKPVEGRQYELGVKSSLLDDRFSTQLAVFQLEDENRAIVDSENEAAFLAAGDDTTKGVETAIFGSPYRGVDLFAGYAYVDTDLKTDPTARHHGVLGAKYSFRSGALDGLYVGGRSRVSSSLDAFEDDVKISSGGYAIADVLLGYWLTDSVKLQLNVNNVFDREYVERINNTTTRGVFYGKPVNAVVSISGAL